MHNITHQHIINLFKRYSHQPWACLLDSCEQTSLHGRFDIVGFDPCLQYCFQSRYNDQSNVHTLSGPEKDRFHLPANIQCPFQALAQLHQQFVSLIEIPEQTTIPDNIPFLLGALAAFGYDTNVSSDHIKDAKPNQYKIPDINVGFYTTAIVFDNKTQTSYICSTSNSRALALKQELLDASGTYNLDKFSLTSAWQANVTEQEYAEKFEDIQAYLHAGDCYQVNFAQRFTASYSGNEFSAYETLSAVNKAPFSAFFRLAESCILSVSPERFVLVKDKKVESMPIKGTRKRSQDPILDAALANELLSAEKDQAENLMIVDLLRNDLSKHCQAHSVKVPQLFALESYPAVHHLVSTVVGELKTDASPYNLLQGAFPGGSITGAPKVRAMQIIQELEPDKRAIYCGSIGYIGIRNDMDTNICIRTLLAENNTLYCWAGGGIVVDSEASDEYQESLHKLAKILPILAT